MKIIRIQLKRFLVVFVLAALVITVHVLLRGTPGSDPPSDCHLPPHSLRKVEDLLGAVLGPLTDLKLTHFLCYQSLWGALKHKGPLPWHYGLELCILNREVAAVDEGFLVKTFRRHGLALRYISSSGYYRVTRADDPLPAATLTVFEEDPVVHQMRRVGFIHRMMPPNACEELNCFPPELIVAPLPTVKFGEHSLAAPRDGIEMQKYLFPDTWWKDLTPPHCQKKGE